MARKDFLKSSRRLRRKRIIFKIILFLVCFCLIVAGLTSFFYLPFFRIKQVLVAGNNFIDSSAISDRIMDKLDGKYNKLYPKNNLLIFPRKSILAELPLEIKRIKKIKLNRKFPNTISAMIEERNNFAILCQEGECAFIDETGYVFEAAPYFSAGVFITFFDDRMAAGDGAIATAAAAVASAPIIKKSLGTNLLEEEEFRKMIDFSQLMIEMKNEVVKIVLKKENNYEIYSKEGWRIILNSKNEPQKSYLNLVTALDANIKKNRSKLDYVDLRYGNRVYFKYKQGGV